MFQIPFDVKQYGRPPYIVGLCECTRSLAQGIIVIIGPYGRKSLAPISGRTRSLALQKNGFTVNWVKGSS